MDMLGSQASGFKVIALMQLMPDIDWRRLDFSSISSSTQLPKPWDDACARTNAAPLVYSKSKI